MFTLDPFVFDPAAVAEETRAFNHDLATRLAALPDQWSFPPQVVRERREQGLGPFPPPERSPRAIDRVIDGLHGPVKLRILKPLSEICGAFLHIHGGGWTFGGADLQDARLIELADRTGLIAVSVDYRLAPEHPYPCGPDDCESAALWLAGPGSAEFGISRLAIGGDSAGANLAAATLLRLRDRHRISPFRAAVFIAGCFDLRLTPSARTWGSEKLVLNTRDLDMFVRHYLSHGHDPAQPDISPLLADLKGMPMAHFVVGTRDPLLDDTMFMASRWISSGNKAELRIFPGGCHVFQNFGLSISLESNNLIDNFLRVSMQ
ncbi:MAG: alpha/beta hydrolase [Pannonibacter sp.]